MIVRVYWNLHKNCWSIQCKRKVIDHSNSLVLKNVTFIVSEKGRERVLKEKRKNVHAFAEGEIVEDDSNPSFITSPEYISYNPYRFPWFYEVNNLTKIETCHKVLFTPNKKLIKL